jgi:hypothetical protein
MATEARMIDWGTAAQWAGVMLSLFSMIGAFTAWLSVRGKATQEAINRIEHDADTQMQALDRRVTTIEVDLRHAISKSDLAEIYDRLKANGETTASMNARLGTIETSVRDLLLEIQRRGLEK